jgi:hypothetical protein
MVGGWRFFGRRGCEPQLARYGFAGNRKNERKEIGYL